MQDSASIEDFHGVYLLVSQNPNKRYFNRCYIGYTVDPNRRINQHNRGIDFGGAKQTNNKGPWTIVMIIHGFPNNITALQFEWAWQSPRESSRLKMIQEIEKKKRNETYFDYNFRILAEMLRTGPWNRMSLTIRWLADNYVRDFPPEKIPPIHMQICHGHVTTAKRKPKSKQQHDNNGLKLHTATSSYDNENEQCLLLESQPKKLDGLALLSQIKQKITPSVETETNDGKIFDHVSAFEYNNRCYFCWKVIENSKRSKIYCINSECKLTCHMTCLANKFLQPGHYIPIEIDCPICKVHVSWGDLIRKKNCCNDLKDEENNQNTDYNDDFFEMNDNNNDDSNNSNTDNVNNGDEEDDEIIVLS